MSRLMRSMAAWNRSASSSSPTVRSATSSCRGEAQGRRGHEMVSQP